MHISLHVKKTFAMLNNEFSFSVFFIYIMVQKLSFFSFLFSFFKELNTFIQHECITFIKVTVNKCIMCNV